MKLTSIDFAIILAYILSLFAISFYYSRRQQSRSEYFLGGRQTHWLLAGGSILATLISTTSFLVVPGELIRYGVTYFIGLVGLLLVAPVVTRVLLPIFHKLPITSVYDYLDQRFSPNIRVLAEAVFLLRVSLWMALIVYTCSLAVVEVTNWSLYGTIAAIGLITTLYTAAGGFRTIIWTNNLQLLITFGGTLGIPVFIWFITKTSPLEWWSVFSSAGRTQIEFFSTDLTVRMTLVSVILSQFFWHICLNASDQVVVQRYLSTPSLPAARRSVWFSTGLHMFAVASLNICGLALFAVYWRNSGLDVQQFQNQIATQADQLLPRFIGQSLPVGISGILLASVLAAGMDSLASGINSLASVISGYFRTRLAGSESNPGSLRAEKLVAFFAGAAVTGAACLLSLVAAHGGWNLLELATRVGGLLIGPMGVLFFGGILFHWVGSKAVLTGFSVSLASSIFISFGKEIFGLERSVSLFYVVPIPFLVGLLVAAAIGFFLPSPPVTRIEGLVLGRMRPIQR
jgi:solute:Na+ symporter, SSS family